jgi:tripartite-type tricarboxylate transporter receptor subunit TctC
MAFGALRSAAVINRRNTVQALVGACAAIAVMIAPGAASAQGKYPDHPVRFVLPFAAGGVADVTARIVAEKLGDRLGQRFVVENVPGAGGIAAARAALAGGNDGYTLALLTNGTAISVPLFKSLPFDPLKDFTPISSIGQFNCVFATNSTGEYDTLAKFLAATRANPGKLNIGTISVGSTQHLAAELFRSTAGIGVVLVPFRASPEAVVSLLRNDVQMVIDFPAALASGLSDGKLRPVATSGPDRWPTMPEVPTAAEAGVPGYEVTSWNALYAPAGTPKEVITTINAALHQVLADADVKKKLRDMGIEAKASTPAEINAKMRADIDKWGKVIAKANIPQL